MPHTRYWTDPERERLRKFDREGLTHWVMAERLGRPIDAVRRELRRLGLSRTPARTKRLPQQPPTQP